MRVFACALLLTLLVPPAQADPIDDYVRRQMVVSHIPGVAVAIVRKGRIESI